jgi:hypothetical protein
MCRQAPLKSNPNQLGFSKVAVDDETAKANLQKIREMMSVKIL